MKELYTLCQGATESLESYCNRTKKIAVHIGAQFKDPVVEQFIKNLHNTNARGPAWTQVQALARSMAREKQTVSWEEIIRIVRNAHLLDDYGTGASSLGEKSSKASIETTRDEEAVKFAEIVMELLKKESNTTAPRREPLGQLPQPRAGYPGQIQQPRMGYAGNTSGGTAPPPYPRDVQQEVTCFNCHETGHIARNCPKIKFNQDEREANKDRRYQQPPQQPIVYGRGQENQAQPQRDVHEAAAGPSDKGKGRAVDQDEYYHNHGEPSYHGDNFLLEARDVDVQDAQSAWDAYPALRSTKRNKAPDASQPVQRQVPEWRRKGPQAPTGNSAPEAMTAPPPGAAASGPPPTGFQQPPTAPQRQAVIPTVPIAPLPVAMDVDQPAPKERKTRSRRELAEIRMMKGKKKQDLVETIGDIEISLPLREFLQAAPNMRSKLAYGLYAERPRRKGVVQPAPQEPHTAVAEVQVTHASFTFDSTECSDYDTDEDDPGYVEVSLVRNFYTAGIIVHRHYKDARGLPRVCLLAASLLASAAAGTRLTRKIVELFMLKPRTKDFKATAVSGVGGDIVTQQFVHFKIMIGGVVTKVTAWIVDENKHPTSYNLLLGRGWLRKAGIHEYHDTSSLSILGPDSRRYQVTQWPRKETPPDASVLLKRTIAEPPIIRRDTSTEAESTEDESDESEANRAMLNIMRQTETAENDCTNSDADTETTPKKDHPKVRR